MGEGEVICSPEVCKYKFEALEKAMERLAQYDEQRREEIAVMKEAIITIKASNEQIANAVLEIKNNIPKPNQDNQWFKLFEKVVVALIIMLGAIVGLNPDIFIK